MKRSQKIFIGIMLVFFVGLVLLAVDISRKTSFPGAKSRQNGTVKDSVDSTLSPKTTIQQP